MSWNLYQKCKQTIYDCKIRQCLGICIKNVNKQYDKLIGHGISTIDTIK